MFRYLALLALLVWLAPTTAAPPPPPEVRVAIDISGSMKHNDPRNLRRSALRLLVGLLPEGSRAGVWIFGGQARVLVADGPVDRRWKARARRAAARIHSRGQFTDIESALKTVVTGWKGGRNPRPRHLIFLTDGIVDVSKDKSRSAASRRRILEALVPRLRDLGVKVHTVALSAQADHELMRALSDGTGGWYERAETAKALQKVFLRLSEKATNPETLPLDDNRFEVDDSIREVTLLVFRRQGAPATRLVPPDGRPFAADQAPDSVRWHQDDGYDLITLADPAPGVWAIQAEVDPDNRALILTDLHMQVEGLQDRVVLGQSLPLQVSFHNGDKRVEQRRFLAMVKVEAVQRGPGDYHSRPRILRDDGQGDDPMAYDGRLEFRFAPQGGSGRGQLLITADGETFKRRRRHLFELTMPAHAELVPGKAQTTLRVRPEPGILAEGSVNFHAEWLGADGKAHAIPLQAVSGGLRNAVLDPAAIPGKVRVRVRVQGRTSGGALVDTWLPELGFTGSAPAVPVNVAEKQPDASFPWPWIAAGNAVLLVLGAGLFWWLRRRARRDPIQLLDPDEDIADVPLEDSP